ncbi:MAG: hypothetical protein ACON5E_06460 [Flavobacteriales bacterium]
MKITLASTLILLTLLFACQYDQNKGVILTVSIGDNPTIDTIFITNYDNYDDFAYMTKNENGFFKDTLSFNTGFYYLDIGSEYSIIYLEIGYNLNITIDNYHLFNESIRVISGDDKHVNQYLFDYVLNKNQKLKADRLIDLEKDEYQLEIGRFKLEENQNIEKLKLKPETAEFLLNLLDEDLENTTIMYDQEYEFKYLMDTIP